MKNTIKLFGIATLVAAIGLSMVACPTPSSNGGGGGDNSGGNTTPKVPTYTSIAGFTTWLASQPDNDSASPYTVKLNVSNLGDGAATAATAGSVGKALRDNSTKYVNLDLSGSTISTIPELAFNTGYKVSDNSYNINAGCPTLTGITIPASVTSIGNYAFSNCTNLASVTIPNGVNITSSNGNGYGVFNGCTNFTAFIVDDANTALSSQDGVLYTKDKKMLIMCPTGKTGALSIPSGVTNIIDYAFLNCNKLTSVNIPDGVISIGIQAFAGCYGLASVNIPKSVTSINSSSFQNCTSLTAITVDPANTSLSSQDGVLYSNTKNTLITYPAGKTDSSFTIPASVTNIFGNAFYGCASLTSVTIPGGVTRIGGSAFSVCRSLTSVTFETGSNISDATDTGFGNNAFPEGSNGNGGNALKTAYLAASPKEGTYTRPTNGSTWTKS